MADQAGRESALLGMEVLERASRRGLEVPEVLERASRRNLEVLERAARRRVDWTNTNPTLRTLSTDHDDGQNPPETTHRPVHLDQAVETIRAFMAQTTHQCMNFHRRHHCSELSGIERSHVSRFHTHRAAGRTTPEPPTWKQEYSSPGEDFSIEVAPGSYSITAGIPHARQHTQRVSLHAGDSITLTFDLSPLS